MAMHHLERVEALCALFALGRIRGGHDICTRDGRLDDRPGQDRRLAYGFRAENPGGDLETISP